MGTILSKQPLFEKTMIVDQEYAHVGDIYFSISISSLHNGLTSNEYDSIIVIEICVTLMYHTWRFPMLSILLFALLSDSATIHTTVADSTRVAFIAQTPVDWATVEYESLRFIRFSDSPLSDSIGYPELPMITCLVAFPDSVTPELEYSVSDESTLSVLPVYPSPAHIISNEVLKSTWLNRIAMCWQKPGFI